MSHSLVKTLKWSGNGVGSLYCKSQCKTLMTFIIDSICHRFEWKILVFSTFHVFFKSFFIVYIFLYSPNNLTDYKIFIFSYKTVQLNISQVGYNQIKKTLNPNQFSWRRKCFPLKQFLQNIYLFIYNNTVEHITHCM